MAEEKWNIPVIIIPYSMPRPDVSYCSYYNPIYPTQVGHSSSKQSQIKPPISSGYCCTQRAPEVQMVAVQEPLQSKTLSQGKGFSEAWKCRVGPLAT